MTGLCALNFQDLNPTAQASVEAAIALSIITYIGLISSLLCLSIFIISYLAEKCGYSLIALTNHNLFNQHDRRKQRASIHGKILINLSLALMGVYLFFLIGGHVTTIPVLCGISSALLHYFLLVFFGWTAVEAVWLYLKLVKVLGVQSVTSNYTLKTSIPTWGNKEINYLSH